MRILKEYSALSLNSVLTDDNSIELLLQENNRSLALGYVVRSTEETNPSDQTLNALTAAVSDVFHTLSKNARPRESTRISCSCHKYYYMLVFEFSEAALPLHTLNKAVKVLGVGGKPVDGDSGFMNIVHLVNRISVSIDKLSEKMRITIIKEKNYPVLKSAEELPPVVPPFTLNFGNDEGLAVDFSKRLFQKMGSTADRFMISPQMFLDNIAIGELNVVFLRDSSGNCAGGAVWQKTYGIIVLMIIAAFDDSVEAKNMLLTEFEKQAFSTDASYIVSEKKHSELIAGYFDISDDDYNYKSIGTLRQKRLTSYIKPELLPLVKKAYKNLDVSREIREINYSYSFQDQYSVLTAKIDTISSEALLSLLWPGDDLKLNILQHISALKKVGIDRIYFRLDMGNPEEAIVSDLIQSCGFELRYLWPYSSDKGDIIIFSYADSTFYELKPCAISPVNRSNADKIPKLIRSVYGENYPSQYLYTPKLLMSKIRKREIYPFVAIDEKGDAVGMISFIKLSHNQFLFEIGQLMVMPIHRGTSVANHLIEYVNTTGINSLDFDAIFSESVTNHKFSQRSCINGGFQDTALKLNIMSPEAFDLEEERRQVGRMTCVVSCIERADEQFTVYLPKIYKDNIRCCYEGLKLRTFVLANSSLNEECDTEFTLNKDELTTSKTVSVTFSAIGKGLAEAVGEIEKFALGNDVKCMLVNIPLCDPDNAAAVDLLREKKFVFGGVMPYWFADSDALLMQKLYGNSPDWGSIKLFSRKIREVAKMIKSELEAD